jgi:hypothetical protein
VSAKRNRRSGSSGRAIGPASPKGVDAEAQGDYRQMDRRTQIGVLIVAMILIGVVVIGADFVLGAISGQAAPSSSPSASPTPVGVVMPGRSGHWTNVGPYPLVTILELEASRRTSMAA